MMATTNSGASAGPKALDDIMSPVAVPRSLAGNQLEIVRYDAAGKIPSPTPKATRTRSICTRLLAKPVMAVNTDHQAMPENMTFWAPKRSARSPPGI